MKKIIHLFVLLTLVFLVNNCAGYKPIFGSSNLQFNIVDYKIEGNEILSQKIYSKLHKSSKSIKSENKREISLTISTEKNKFATSKDSSGKILEYKITINSKIKVTDYLNESKILEKNFSASQSYKTQDQYSDTLNSENKSVENLINEIYRELLVILSQNIVTK